MAAAGDVWIACTDADSVVAPCWLTCHLALADAGADVVRGTVEPDPADLDDAVLARYWASHVRDDDHPYVHGANLGISARSYLALGGFAAVPAHEDRDLVERAYAAGLTVVSSARCPVITSGRRDGRAPDGFAAVLARLAAQAADQR